MLLMRFNFSDKNQESENHLLLEHKEVMDELHKDLQEKDERIEEIQREHEEQLKVMYTCHRSYIKE